MIEFNNHYLTTEENETSKEFLKNGYIIRNVVDLKSLDMLKIKIYKFLKFDKKLNITEIDFFLNKYHIQIKKNKLNDIRMQIITSINKDKLFRKNYFQLFRTCLECLVGSELSMQVRMNFSIQIPKDNSSLLPLHSDVWSGDSPFEVVTWLPLVDVYKTKSMYILPPQYNEKINKILSKNPNIDGKSLYNKIKKYLIWLDLKYGQILIFNQALPHGNIINMENETRWSINCRFKGAFTPYGDKKIGEFFEPITLRAASLIGMNYKLPKIND